MALLNSTNIYKNPQSNIIYGSGNKKYTDAQIKEFINTPGRTDQEILSRALLDGVSRDEIVSAGKGNARFSQSNVDNYLTSQGITKDLVDVPPPMQVSTPSPVKASPVTVGNNETVQGRMAGLLQDQNNPLNVQAQTFGNQQANKRGLLNSSIAVSASQDAMYKNALPIATQDAATFYDAKKTNSSQGLTADMFNSDQSTRVGMFNSGQNKDIMLQREGNQIQRERNELDRYIADMDTDNKLAIANIQAMANDSGIMGDMGKNFMNLYQQTAADPNITPEVKAQIFNQLRSQFEGITSLLPSFERAGKKLTFGTSNSAPASDAGIGGADTEKKPDASTLPPKINDAIGKINVLGYEPEPRVLAGVANYERLTGNKVDRSLVVPEQLYADLVYGNSPYSGTIENARAYDYVGLANSLGVGKATSLSQLFIPVYAPGIKRADQQSFYMWNQDLLKNMK